MVETPDDAGAWLRRLPKVDRILENPALEPARARHGRGLVALHVRATVDAWRKALLAGRFPADPAALEVDAVAARVAATVARDAEPYPRILNGTGVILNSGLGRAPIAACAVEALERTGRYGLLEVGREAGAREARDTRAVRLLCALTGAEAGLVVNNNAAATLLILATLGSGREVICSRGEMVEIGGSYRIPDVMEASGCRLVEVGTTNKTHLSDYERAITEETAALLVVHTSNYRIVGFTAAPELGEIAALARRHGLPAVHDLGSGSILGPEELGFGDEPPVRKSFEAGMQVVCMSGDKLLGGPQAGIILGERELIQRMRRHPLARALRVDKAALAALEATLPLFLDRERLEAEHPVTRMLRLSPDELLPRAEALVSTIEEGLGGSGPAVEAIALTSETGSGALPTQEIPSAGLAITAGRGADALARRLRFATPGIFSRILEGRVCIDLRTIFPDEDRLLAEVLVPILSEFRPR